MVNAEFLTKTSIVVAQIRFTPVSGGAPQNLLLTDAHTTVPLLGAAANTFDRRLTFEPITQGGTLDEDDSILKTSTTYEFVQQAVRGEAMAKLYARVWEWITLRNTATGDYEVEQRNLGRGDLVLAEVNPDGEPGTARWTVRNPKALTELPIRADATELCVNEFGSGKVCTFDRNGAAEDVTITAAAGSSLTVTGLTETRPEFWSNGRLVVGEVTPGLGGVSAKIRDVLPGSVFRIYRKTPEAWASTIAASGSIAARIYPGCTLSLAQCGLFDQLENFNGWGVGMPNNNPLFEVPRAL
ncbi:MAG: hypothetical protein AAFP86_10100 [Planctomycetota bacterium]